MTILSRKRVRTGDRDWDIKSLLMIPLSSCSVCHEKPPCEDALTGKTCCSHILYPVNQIDTMVFNGISTQRPGWGEKQHWIEYNDSCHMASKLWLLLNVRNFTVLMVQTARPLSALPRPERISHDQKIHTLFPQPPVPRLGTVHSRDPLPKSRYSCWRVSRLRRGP